MERGPDLLRRAALIAAAALAVHELRYLAGPGDGAAIAAAEQGHGYLSWAAAGVVALVLAAAAVFLHALVGALRRLSGERRSAPFACSWLANAGALALIYSVQELAEDALAQGGLASPGALLAGGGWTAYLFALALGAVVALALRGADEAIALAARPRRSRLELPRPARVLPRPPAAVRSPGTGVIALNLAGRAPPASR
jgi:hypothetical protein